MGITKRTATSIYDFWPDDTETVIWLPDCSISICEIIDLCKVTWGDDISLTDIKISSEYIHTECIYYNRYDPGDYTMFIRIEYCGDAVVVIENQ